MIYYNFGISKWDLSYNAHIKDDLCSKAKSSLTKNVLSSVCEYVLFIIKKVPTYGFDDEW